MAPSRKPVLVDTNVIIQGVRTECWSAITGQLAIETVETCVCEARAGNPSRPGYVAVTDAHLRRLAKVHRVTEEERSAFALHYPGADGMDDGERDLFAHAFARGGDVWLLCSADKAAILAGVSLGWGDRLCSLAEIAGRVGVRPSPPLKAHFGEEWLATWRTHFLLTSGSRSSEA